MKKLFLIPLLLVLVAALIFSGCTAQAPAGKVLKVGALYGLTGPGSEAQMGWRDVMLLCQDWINENGGIKVGGEQYQVQCIIEDHKQSPQGCIDAATKLVYQDGVQFLLGGVVPVQNEATTSVTEPKKVLYCAVKNDILYPDKPYFFVAYYSYAAPLPHLYDVTLQLYPNVKSIGFIIEDEAGAMAAAEGSQMIAKGLGLTLKEPHIHPWEAPEYYPIWTKIIAEKPDAVDIGLKFPDGLANCISQGRELGYDGPMFSGAGGGDPRLIIKMIGNNDYARDFIYGTFDPYGDNVPTMAQEVVKRWDATHKDPFDPDGTQQWDVLWMLKQVIEKAQSLDPTEVAKTWENIDTLETALGPAKMGGEKSFGIKHMGFPPLAISRIQNGTIDFTKWVDSYMP